jgi:hypothetical protein
LEETFPLGIGIQISQNRLGREGFAHRIERRGSSWFLSGMGLVR